ncbi:hypothetical protein PR048_029937 [Dryococelus australis]|uniref:Uncharacterized protein n=1 Tax=Dryococelus australis TaxID=614101 RepID=A0ABQ9GA79_9NEOP|nr:hypothetical protein PR048_029937 [Dryococelus australis]
MKGVSGKILIINDSQPAKFKICVNNLVKLPDEMSETIFQILLCCLEKHGFDIEHLKQHLVGFTSDCASVMLGKHSGVAQKCPFQCPNIIIWHCMNHRLELTLDDSVNEVRGVNHFHIFMVKLYTLYSRSPMNQHQLAE